MNLGSDFNNSINRIVEFFDLSPDYRPMWGVYAFNFHRVNDFTDRSWRFEMDAPSRYIITYEDPSVPFKSHFRLRKGSIERFYKDGYTLFAEKHTDHGTSFITFTLLSNDLCDISKSVPWSN